MSNITKIFLRIIMMRVRNKSKPLTAEKQCGFLEGKSTTNAILILHTIIERALLEQKEVQCVYLCFIDYNTAFDKELRDEIITQLT